MASLATATTRPRLSVLRVQQAGLLLVILLLGGVLAIVAGRSFLNANTLIQTATDASFFAIMAVGATIVIISGGIDLSVGSVFALSGVTMAMALRAWAPGGGPEAVLLGILLCVGTGLLCGLINGGLVVGLRVHPFIITLGTMWIFRGIAFVTSRAESVLVPDALTNTIKCSLGLPQTLSPLPMLLMVLVAVCGSIFLSNMVTGRYIFAVGGNAEASRYAGLRTDRVLLAVYGLAGLTAGIAGFLGGSYYGSTSCADATGYELYVIASAVVGGASLTGGRGSVISAMLGAILITLIRQSIRTLHFDQNYEWIIIGCAIIVAVVLDRASATLAERRLAATARVDNEPKEEVS